MKIYIDNYYSCINPIVLNQALLFAKIWCNLTLKEIILEARKYWVWKNTYYSFDSIMGSADSSS